MPGKRVLSLNNIDCVSNENDDSGFTSKRCRKNKNLDKEQISSQSRSQPQNFATTIINTSPVIDVTNDELMSNESSNAAVISTLCEKIKGLEQTVQLLRDQVRFLLSFVGAVDVPLSSDRQCSSANIADIITESYTAAADTVTRGVTASIVASEMSDPPVRLI